MQLDEFYAGAVEMLQRGVTPESLHAELESAIALWKYTHAHDWQPTGEIEQYRCACGATLTGMLVR